MDNKYMQNYNRYRCTRDCTNCPFSQKMISNMPNSMRTSNYGGMYVSYDYYIDEIVADFWKQLPQTIFWHDNNGICYTRYEWLQDCLLEYSRKNYPWEMPVYMEVSSQQVILVSDEDSYEKYIKDIFKSALDIAAEITKNKNPQFSIVIDEIGLLLADDITEAVRKVISILDKASKMGAFR